MTLDTRLLDILRCPASGQRLDLMTPAQLARANRAIAEGDALPASSVALREGLITAASDRIYRIEDGIPVMLVSESIQVPPARLAAD